MSGNVDEWCFDGYDNRYYLDSPKDNPFCISNSHYRVVRGGDWGHIEKNCRVSSRSSGTAHVSWGIRGFRCVKEL